MKTGAFKMVGPFNASTLDGVYEPATIWNAPPKLIDQGCQFFAEDLALNWQKGYAVDG